jgi:hypothetical protein
VASAAAAFTIKTSEMSAQIGAGSGLTALTDIARGSALAITPGTDGWEIDLSAPVAAKYSSSVCSWANATQPSPTVVTQWWKCNAFNVTATYELRPGTAFVTKTMSIQRLDVTSLDSFTVDKVVPWSNMTVGIGSDGAGTGNGTGLGSFLVRGNPYYGGGEIAAFGRFDGQTSGFFVSVANPFVQFSARGAGQRCAGRSGVNMRGSDLPGMPLRNLGAAECQAACTSSAKCEAYVFLPAACDNQPSPACYLKATGNGTKDKDTPCACFGAKPFAPTATPTPAPAPPPASSITLTAEFKPTIVHDPTR